MESLIVRYIVITEAINSSKLIDFLPMSAGGNLYRQDNLSELNPPIPCSHASDIVVPVGSVNLILCMSMTLVLTYCRNPI